MTEERWNKGPHRRIYSRTMTGRMLSLMNPPKGKTLIYMWHHVEHLAL